MLKTLGPYKELHWAGGPSARDYLKSKLRKETDQTLFAHMTPGAEPVAEYHSQYCKVVIPIRHPAAVARTYSCHPWGKWKWVHNWEVMSKLNLDAFYFPWEWAPFDELEKYIGRPVNHITKKIGQKTPADYPFPEDQKAEVERILAECPIAKRFYGES